MAHIPVAPGATTVKADPNDPAFKKFLRRVAVVKMAMQMGAMITPMVEDDELVALICEDIDGRAEVYYDQIQKIREAKNK